VKKKRYIIVGCLVVLIGAYIVVMVPSIHFRSEWDRTVEALRSLPRERVEGAVQAFIHTRKTSATLPASVSFAELVAGGYLRTNEVAAFGGKQAEVFFDADESHPQDIWIRVHLTDTRDAVEFNDGSIALEPRL